jgi:hypothetical protein
MRRKRLFWIPASLLVALLPSLALAQGWSIPKPGPGLMPNPVMGKALFANHCAGCHGGDLKGSEKGPPCCTRFMSRHIMPMRHSSWPWPTVCEPITGNLATWLR